MGHSHGRRWTDAQIEYELCVIVDKVGRMPTMGELRDLGLNALGCKIARTNGGFRGWAARLGVELRGSETHRGQDIEIALAKWLADCKFSVEPQSTKAKFDLRVNGWRVDVKSAVFSDYVRLDGQHVRGHVFGINNRGGSRCGVVDLFALCGVDTEGCILWRYFVPELFLRIHTATITPNGKYSRFREDLSVLGTSRK